MPLECRITNRFFRKVSATVPTKISLYGPVNANKRYRKYTESVPNHTDYAMPYIPIIIRYMHNRTICRCFPICIPYNTMQYPIIIRMFPMYGRRIYADYRIWYIMQIYSIQIMNRIDSDNDLYVIRIIISMYISDNISEIIR